MLKNAAVPKRPYQLKGTKEFFIQVKMGNYQNVDDILAKNRYFVFQINALGKTAVHKAVTNKDHKMVRLLLKHHPDVNKRDFNGKTPLTYAIESDCLNTAKNLLLQKARPWFDGKQIYADQSKSPKMGLLIERAKKFWALMAFLKPGEKEKMWTQNAHNVIY